MRTVRYDLHWRIWEVAKEFCGFIACGTLLILVAVPYCALSLIGKCGDWRSPKTDLR